MQRFKNNAKKKEMIQVYTQHIQSTIAPSFNYAASGQPGLVSSGNPMIHPDPLLIITKMDRHQVSKS